jgi:hypothetical protein
MPGSPPSVTAFDFGTAGQLAEKNKNHRSARELGRIHCGLPAAQTDFAQSAEQCLQVTGCTSAGKLEMTPIRRRPLLLWRLGEFLFQVGVGCANAVNVSMLR